MKSPIGLFLYICTQMSFKEYLTNKNIDSDAYKASAPNQWLAFATIFAQMHPKSFTMQKLNLINGIRRQFPYQAEIVEQEQVKPKVARPMMKPKAQPVEETASDVTKKLVMKPKMGKPVMKPKMSTDQTKESKEEVKPKLAMKPKMVRPVIKPKPKDPTE